MADLDDSGFFIDADDTASFDVFDEPSKVAYDIEDEVVPDLPRYLLPSRAYDVLKWFGLLFLPALAWFVSIVGPAWGYEVDAIVTTINALGTVIGLCIGASQVSAMGR